MDQISENIILKDELMHYKSRLRKYSRIQVQNLFLYMAGQILGFVGHTWSLTQVISKKKDLKMQKPFLASGQTKTAFSTIWALVC